MRTPVWIVLAAALSSGCAGAGSDAAPTHYEYSPETQAKLAAEIEQMPADWVTPWILADYAAVRAEIRAMREAD